MTDKEYIENLYKKYWECMINKMPMDLGLSLEMAINCDI